MEEIITLIEAGDKAAVEIGIEFIQEDDYFVFGAILKSEYCTCIAPRFFDGGAKRSNQRAVSQHDAVRTSAS
jgi:hypothetical protein